MIHPIWLRTVPWSFIRTVTINCGAGVSDLHARCALKSLVSFFTRKVSDLSHPSNFSAHLSLIFIGDFFLTSFHPSPLPPTKRPCAQTLCHQNSFSPHSEIICEVMCKVGSNASPSCLLFLPGHAFPQFISVTLASVLLSLGTVPFRKTWD